MNAKSWHFFAPTREDKRARSTLNVSPISLMWPDVKPSEKQVSSPWIKDLGVEDLVTALSHDRRYAPFIRQTLTALNADPEVIAWRQAVLSDFVRNPELAARAEALLPSLHNLRQGNSLLGQRHRNLLLETADRLSELDLYTGIVQELQQALQAATLESTALTGLRDNLAVLLADEGFQMLCQQLPEMRAPLENIASLTIGINLDTQLQPVSAVLLAINDRQLGEPVSLLDRLIGGRSSENDENGLAPLHFLPRDPDQRPFAPLFQDLDRLLTQVAQPVARSLNRYVRISTGSLMNLEYELAFYAAAARLMRDCGVGFCQPEVVPTGERLLEIEELMNINLLAQQKEKPVPSDAKFGAEGRIAILTGPNSGGKTTYLQSVGLAQVMFQAGLFVPARRARMSPVDTILTHFPRLETRQEGRLAEEAGRLREIFRHATAHSLVLLNETFSSTASGEAVYLAQDILCGLRSIGVRAVYATHLAELAEQLEEIEVAVEGDSGLYSLVAGVRLTEDAQAVPTFRIARGLPLGRSYAQEIARRHGISLEQILEARRNKEE